MYLQGKLRLEENYLAKMQKFLNDPENRDQASREIAKTNKEIERIKAEIAKVIDEK